jgi:hypothetical protein
VSVIAPICDACAEVGAVMELPCPSHGDGGVVTTTSKAESNGTERRSGLITGESDIDRRLAQLVPFEAMVTRQPPEWLVDDFLVAGSSAVIHSPPAVGKSFVALDLAACVASGMWWHGREVQQHRVLYIAAEGTGGLPLRVRAWKAHNHMPEVDEFDFLPGGLNLLDVQQASVLARVVHQQRYGLVVIDTAARVMVGGDENSAKDMGRFVAGVSRMQDAGAAVLVVHHPGKDVSKGMRGNSALKGALDTEIEAVASQEHALTLMCRKQKEAAEFLPIRLSLQVVRIREGEGFATSCAVSTRSPDDVSRSEEVQELFLRSFRHTGATRSQLRDAVQEALGVSQSRAYELVNDLVGSGVVVNQGTEPRPFYVLRDRSSE